MEHFWKGEALVMRPKCFAKFLIFLFLLAAAVWQPKAAAAEQNAAVPTKAAAAESEPTDVLQKSLDRIAEQREQIRSLEQRKRGQQEAFKKILEKRLDRATLELLDLGVAYAKQVAAQSEDVQDLAAHRDGTGDILTEHYQLGLETIADIRAAISLPAEDLSGAQDDTARTIGRVGVVEDLRESSGDQFLEW
jgi:TolA-binding protein